MKKTLLGIPWDGDSSFQPGAALAPPRIRAALRSESSNTWNECGIDVVAALGDAGDLEFPAGCDPRQVIEQGVAKLLEAGAVPILLGGDHSVTWPILRAVGRRHPGLTILHFDAHADLYDEFEGSRTSHACPFARILEEGLARRLVQFGIRTLTPHLHKQIRRFGVEVVPIDSGLAAMREIIASLEGPLYLSLDLDVLDPAFVPGISHPEPGGFSTRELISLIQAVPRGILVGADIVELNPENDLRDLTARVAAKLLKEIVGLL